MAAAIKKITGMANHPIFFIAGNASLVVVIYVNYHSAREETKIGLGQFVEAAISNNLSLNISYNYYEREAESSAYPEISEMKNYSKNGISISVSYSIDEFQL